MLFRSHIICSLGSLEPAPAAQWLGLAHKLEAALQGQRSLPGGAARIEERTTHVRRGPRRTRVVGSAIAIDPDRVAMEEARAAGPVHVGHQLWRQLQIEAILRRAGLSARACVLTEAMTLNRLIAPRSEHAMPEWMQQTALSDLLHTDFAALHDDALYRNLDRLHPKREQIERELAERERTLRSEERRVGKECRL